MYSNRKGSNFERLVAKIIARHFGVSTRECYRTPLSGGHPFGDRGDLVMSPALLKLFPFVVECKHTKAWRIEHLFKPTKMMESWAEQVLISSSEAERAPIIIFRGQGTPILAATMEQLVPEPVSYIRLMGSIWAVRPLAQFLAELNRPAVTSVKFELKKH